jgi:hypothetical protein
MNRMSRFGYTTALSFALALVVSACSSTSGVTNPSPNAQPLTTSQLQTVVADVFGDMADSLSTLSSTGSIQRRGLLIAPQETITIPPQTINRRVPCPLGGVYSVAGSSHGTVNTDTNFANFGGTVIVSHVDCIFHAGQEISGDPYMSSVYTFTSSASSDSLSVTVTGAWAVKVATGTIRLSIDAGGLRLTMGSTAPCRIQGSITATPGGSVSIAQAC